MRSLLSIICLLLVGCLGDSPGASPPSARMDSDTTAAAILRRADRTALNRAMSGLQNYDYIRERSVSVSDESERLVLRYGHTTRFSGAHGRRAADVIDSTSTGDESAGLWEEYANGPTVEDTLEWGQRLLSAEPLVLSDQGIAYYHYTSLGDTVIAARRTVQIEAQLLSSSSRMGIQSGRFYVDPESGDLVGFDLRFAHGSLLFDEESRFKYFLQMSPDGSWLPFEVAVKTFLNLPLTKGQHFELNAKYSHPTTSEAE